MSTSASRPANVVNVRGHGVEGDGRNDWPALQQLVDAVPNGSTLLFPPPHTGYVILKPLSFAGRSHLRLQGGAGYPTRIEYLGEGGQCAFDFRGAYGMVVDGVHLYAGNPESPPDTVLAMGRQAKDGGSYGEHLLFNACIGGYAAKAVVYCIGCEEVLAIGGKWYLYGGGAKHVLVLSQMDDLGVGGYFSEGHGGSATVFQMLGGRLQRLAPYRGTEDDDCALLYIVGRGSTGDIEISGFHATTAGAFLHIHAPMRDQPAQGPFVFQGVNRIENHGQQACGVRVSGVEGSTVRGLVLRNLNVTNVRPGGWLLRGEDGVRLEGAVVESVRGIQANGALARTSVWSAPSLRADFPMERRVDAVAPGPQGEVRRISVPNFRAVWTRRARDGGRDWFDVTVAEAEFGDEVRVVPRFDPGVDLTFTGAVPMRGMVRIVARNFGPEPLMGAWDFNVELVKGSPARS